MESVVQPTATQGPTWLTEFIYGAPTWVRGVSGVAAYSLMIAVAWRLWTEGSPPVEAQEQMGSILVTALAVATATISLTEFDVGSYGLEVALAVVIGVSVTQAGKVIGRYIFRRAFDSERRTACAWIGLSSVLWTPAAIVPASPRTALLRSIIMWGLLVCVGMALVTAHEQF